MVSEGEFQGEINVAYERFPSYLELEWLAS